MNEYLPEKKEIQARLHKLSDAMASIDVDCAWISQKVDLFYFAGSAQNGHLIVPAASDPVYFARKYYPRAQQESSIEDIRPVKSFKDIENCIMHFLPNRIGIEMDVIPVNQFQYMQKL